MATSGIRAELSKFSSEELRMELARRDVRREQQSRHRAWCHDCAFFEVWPGEPKDLPQDYNPCSKGHPVKFVAPECEGEEHGFYSVGCVDRTPGGRREDLGA